MRIILDKLKVVGGIDTNTPKCVILEICLSLGMTEDFADQKPLQYLISDLYKIERVTVDSFEEEKMLEEIARFVNCREEGWNLYSLMEAFFSLINYDPLTFKPCKETYGKKTNLQPHNLDECLTYKICKFYSIPTTRETTFEEMTQKLKALPPVTSSIISYYQKKFIFASNRSLDEIYSSISNIKSSCYQYLHPYSNNEAIIFSALTFSIDVSSSNCPIEEFISLRVKGLSEYCPIDPDFRKKYGLNPDYYAVRKRWMPHLHFLYQDRELREFAKKEGMNVTYASSSDVGNFLQERFITESFYSGIHPFSKENTPIYQEKIQELSSKNCVSYGNEASKEFVCYPFNELTEFFKCKKYFSNPCNSREVFSESSIKKLELICEFNGSESSKTLLETIRALRTYLKSVAIFEIRWIEDYQRLSQEDKHLAREILTKVLHIGMYMRGWKVTREKYPLSADECIISPDKLFDRDLRVTEGYKELEDLSEKSPVIGAMILKLPLLQYFGGSFVPSDDPKQGYTIGDRLKIVKSGDNGEENIYSCIRLSSNYICASAYRYLNLIKEDPNFAIKELANIS